MHFALGDYILKALKSASMMAVLMAEKLDLLALM
jgi:hypothetical protein